MNQKKLVTCLFILKGKLYSDFKAQHLAGNGDILDTARLYSDSGIDHLFVFDLSNTEYEHEESIAYIKQMARIVEVPISAGGNINRLEDVKKYLYAGCTQVILNSNKPQTAQMAVESAKRFGKSKIAISLENVDILFKHRSEIEENVSELIVLNEEIIAAIENITDIPFTPILNHVTLEKAIEILEIETVKGIASTPIHSEAINIMEIKNALKQRGIPVMTLESSIKWSDFKLNTEGLVPVITQDYRTNEVLMLAYMNKEAFETTLKTGKMTYFSRSRNELWIKGLTSGHLQYVKSLTLDCDNDTILAKISQIGAACHTGKPSCFFQELVKKEYDETNPLKVFENVYKVILDRKENPKTGSYTNYLFDKGIDKILKKVGEEATEIVIAAKNPDPEEIKYEISDFLYHVMVLMAEKGVTWEDVTSELAQR